MLNDVYLAWLLQVPRPQVKIDPVEFVAGALLALVLALAIIGYIVFICVRHKD